jgi:Fuc2NAc and GlcNAc transferase
VAQAVGSITLGFTVLSLLVSAAGVWVSIRISERVGILDIPNERSSHVIPTPRMGGVPMVLAAALTFAGWVFLVGGAAADHEGLSATFLFALAMFFLGFYDDLRNLSPLFRFIVQFVSALLPLVLLAMSFPDVSLGKWELPRWGWVIPGAFWVIWMVNLYNFMDGIDGLAGGEAAIASLFFFLLFARAGEPGWAVANLLVAASAIGFLFHNWPPARVFMGDAGSAFLGAFYGMQSVLAIFTTKIPFIVLVLPFANFIVDATSTLIFRVWRGEKWYHAHRTHFYQKLTRSGMSHKKVTVIELFSVAVCCVSAEICMHVVGKHRIYIVALILLSFLGAGAWVSGWERRSSSARG